MGKGSERREVRVTGIEKEGRKEGAERERGAVREGRRESEQARERSVT